MAGTSPAMTVEKQWRPSQQPRPARRRRHRRPSVSGGGAGRRADQARRHRRSRHRRARRAFPVSRPRRSSHPQRDRARPQSDRAGAHRRAAQRSAPPRPGRCSAACGRPWWSASAAIRPCRRCLPRRCAASRPCCTSRTASWAAPTACWPRASPRSPPASRRWPSSIRGCKAKSLSPATRCGREVIAAAATPFAAPQPGGKFRLLVFGGSQGARVMAEIVPPAIEHLAADRARALERRAAGARRRSRRGARHLCAAWRRQPSARRSSPTCRARMAAAHLVDFALRRFHGRRAVRHRPAGHPGAAAACARSGPVRQCRRAGRGRRGACASSSATSRRSGWQPKSRRWPPTRRGSPRMAAGGEIRRHTRRRRAAGGSGSEGGRDLSDFARAGLVSAIHLLQ